ncbi:hypothetical protein PFISCL1PPCAC_26005, partial [Pristionchus fissidentatus]
QAVNSFMTLNPGLIPHTVNYKFVAPGMGKCFLLTYVNIPAKTSIPLEFKVSHFDEGKMASMFAYQNGKPVGMGHVRYARNSEHLDSSPFLCPDYIEGPDNYPTTVEMAKQAEGRMKLVLNELSKFPLDICPIESPLYPSSEVDRTCLWLRIKPVQGSVKADDGLIIALFISDFTILQVASEIYQKAKMKVASGASLHHTVWIHEANLDPTAWYLTVTECEVISFGRCRLESYIFDESKKCVMTVVQEGYMQRAPEISQYQTTFRFSTGFSENNFTNRSIMTISSSDGPHLAGSYAMDRVFGGLSASQTLGSFMALNPAKHPHTINYKYIAA